jgi:hypothetical protein
MFIPDPDFYPSRILDLGYRIPDPKTATKEGGETKICRHTFFCSHKFHKIENYFIFDGTTKGHLEALRGLSAQLVALRKRKLQADISELEEAAENAVQTLVLPTRRAKEQARLYRQPGEPALFVTPAEALRLPDLPRAKPCMRFPNHLPAGRCREPFRRSSRCTLSCAKLGPS